eukprot:TRINITY_DN60505_c0_g1_i1.p1 TRINITY_DN60505_c0_g1~~TRINITY_DN60505_c0_g1_i1.p1  ORF type:complete len:233 (-),score=29.30 TRINITY_DN60505_c0_g1_i1:270-968(-)
MYVVTVLFFFFFQAEDGIRDAQESRGLGDVYKRQVGDNGHAAALWRRLRDQLCNVPAPDYRRDERTKHHYWPQRLRGDTRPRPDEIEDWWAAKPGQQPKALDAHRYCEEYCQFRLMTLFDRLQPCWGENGSSCDQRMFDGEAARCDNNCNRRWCAECADECLGVHDIECSQCPDYSNWCHECFHEGKTEECDCAGTDSWHFACGRHVTECEMCGNNLCENCSEDHDEVCEDL